MKFGRTITIVGLVQAIFLLAAFGLLVLPASGNETKKPRYIGGGGIVNLPAMAKASKGSRNVGRESEPVLQTRRTDLDDGLTLGLHPSMNQAVVSYEVGGNHTSLVVCESRVLIPGEDLRMLRNAHILEFTIHLLVPGKGGAMLGSVVVVRFDESGDGFSITVH